VALPASETWTMTKSEQEAIGSIWTTDLAKDAKDQLRKQSNKNRAVYYKSAVSQQHWTCHRQSTPTWKTKVNGDGWTVTGHYKPTLQQTTKEQDEFRPNWIFTTVLVHYNMMVSQTAQFCHQRSCADCQQ